MDRHDLAWAAGFFDGEGWANRVGRGVHAQINQSGPKGVPDVLVRFRDAVGRGRIRGPVVKDGREDLYYWIVSSRAHVEVVADAIWPWLGAAKRSEFATALGREPVTAEEELTRTELLAWAGGFYDGEGCASLWPHRTHAGHFTPELAVTQSGLSRPEVLGRFRNVIGRGRIYGPYAQKGATMPVFRWKAQSLADIEQTLYVLAPWIGAVKREQGRRVSRVLMEQGRLPRGNPAWGNRKTHCIRGHAYATARIRPYASRGRGVPRRDSEQCLVCARESARARRAQKRSLGGRRGSA